MRLAAALLVTLLVGCATEGAPTAPATTKPESPDAWDGDPDALPFEVRHEVRVALDGSGDFASLAEAVAAVPAATRVLVGPGTHEGTLVLDRPLLLEAASGRPTLQGVDGPALRVTGGPVVLRELVVRAPRRTGSPLLPAGTSEAEGGAAPLPPGAAAAAPAAPVAFLEPAEPTGPPAVVVESGEVTARHCILVGGGGHGLVLAGERSHGRLDRSSVTAAPGVAADVRRGARLDLHEAEFSRNGIALRNAGGTLRADGGRIATNRVGLLVTGPGTTELRGTWFWSSLSVAVRLEGGADALLEDVSVRAPGGLPGLFVTGGSTGRFERVTFAATPAEDDHHTEGMTRDHVATELRDGTDHHILTGLVTVEDGGRPTLRSCQIENALGHGLLLRDGGGLFEDVTVTDSTFYNVFMEDGADPVFRGCRLLKAGENGLFSWRDAAGLFEDCLLQGNSRQTHDKNSWSQVVLFDGAATRLVGCRVVDGGGAGVVIGGFGTTGAVLDCEVSRNGGVGLTVSAGAEPLVQRTELVDNGDNGVWVTRDGRGRYQDLLVRGSRRLGARVDLASGPRFERCRFEANRNGGLLVRRLSTPVFLDCEVTANEGHGLQVDFDGRPELVGCTIADNEGAGLQLAARGRTVLRACTITGNLEGPRAVEQGAELVEFGERAGL